MQYYNLGRNAAAKMLGKRVPMTTVAEIFEGFATTAIRRARRNGRIRPEAQRQAFKRLAGGWPSGKAPDFREVVRQIGDPLPKAI
jgi:hypothetical protein